jgi:tyrosinase
MAYFQNIVTAMGVSVVISMTMLEIPAIAATLVRKNVVDLTQQEKDDFVDTLKKLKTTPGNNDKGASLYDEIVAVHTAGMTFAHEHLGGQVIMPMPTIHATGPASDAHADAAHENSGFLPWHREYLYRFEQALQSVNPNVTLPYWDWTQAEALDIIFQPDFLGLRRGEGNAIPLPPPPPDVPIPPDAPATLDGGPLPYGNFSLADGWSLIPDLHTDIRTAETLGPALIRYLQDPNPFTPPESRLPLDEAETERILLSPDYDTFRRSVEGEISLDENLDQQSCRNFPCAHNRVHALVGGTLFFNDNPPQQQLFTYGTLSNTPGSPNDPIFWLLHANVDRLWAEWQADDRQGPDFYPSEGQPFGHNLNDPMWPWDGGLSTAGSVGSIDIQPYLPDIALSDIVRPRDALDVSKYGYTYDTLVQKVPEPSSIFGLLGLGALGAASLLRRKRSNVPKSTI